MTRGDLLSLTPDALTALSNRGLVKRATKDLAAAAPVIEVDERGTVHGSHADGTRTSLPMHTDLGTASCTCGASGVCRHRICLVLAYQQRFGCGGQPASQTSGDAPPDGPTRFVPWSPGGIHDATLTTLYGARALTAARITHHCGYSARIHRPTDQDHVARVELATCTVRFLVPGEPGYAHTDATDTDRGEMITLAVWAFREADERGVTDADVSLDVGGRPQRSPTPPVLADAVSVVNEVLLDGAGHAPAVLTASLQRIARELADRGLRWPAAALDDIVEQLTAYQQRSAHHRTERLAELLTEIHARHRAAEGNCASPRSSVLGGFEPAQTPLRRVRLTGLGCRVAGTGTERTAEVYFAHADSGGVLVLRQQWPGIEGRALTGADLADRKVSGTTLRALATGNVITESASRSASRVLRLASSRVAKTGVTPLGGAVAWERLPESVTASDLSTLARELAELPPRLIRPRVAAELIRVVPIDTVTTTGYHPGDQRLEARISDAVGATATVSAGYHAASPGALDALAAALRGDHGTPRFLSGSVHRAMGGIVVRPVAVLTDQGVLVPDLAPGDGSADLDGASPELEPDPMGAALHTALAACAEAAHHGLRRVPPGVRDRLADAAGALAAVGLRTTADLVAALASACGTADDATLVQAWVDTSIRLTTTAELR